MYLFIMVLLDAKIKIYWLQIDTFKLNGKNGIKKV